MDAIAETQKLGKTRYQRSFIAVHLFIFLFASPLAAIRISCFIFFSPQQQQQTRPRGLDVFFCFFFCFFFVLLWPGNLIYRPLRSGGPDDENELSRRSGRDKYLLAFPDGPAR